MRAYKWLLIGAVCLAAAAPAYEIRVHKFLQIKHDVHESITALAEECLKKPGGPTGCWGPTADLAGRSRSRANETYSELQAAARWPDDPTRQDRKASFAKIGYNMFRGCGDLVKKSRVIEEIGLLCSSHYGKLQFLHAQAVDEDRTPRDTYDRILAWADLAFRVARNESLPGRGSLLDANYCEFILTEPVALNQVMRCKSASIYRDWDVSAFFSLSCKNPANSETCTTPPDAKQEDRVAMLAAKGALLHLVQDSFSQSHTSRSVASARDPHGPFVSQVVCAYPTAYFNYADQRSKAHKKGDKPPVRDGSCDDDPRTAAPNDPQTDDVVTASTMVLWHLEKGSRDTFRNYLVSRVFGPRPPKA